jgi:antirestriction protein
MNIVDLRDLADELDTLREMQDADDFDALRFDALQSLESEMQSWGADDLRDAGDSYEPTMIAERDFVEYAQELAEDIGAVPADLTWPMYCIDWERAARELRHDYTSVTFDGDDYLIRSW